jgi:hypothetical protein
MVRIGAGVAGTYWLLWPLQATTITVKDRRDKIPPIFKRKGRDG